MAQPADSIPELSVITVRWDRILIMIMLLSLIHILHEYTHFLNHDTAVKLLVTLYCIIFWWNPVVYLLQKDLEQTLELKCDRAIAQTLNAQERTAYLRAILSAMKQGCTQQPVPQPSTALFRAEADKACLLYTSSNSQNGT